MKRLLLVLVAGAAAVALYATASPAGQQAVTPGQLAALKKQVTTLQKDVKNLKAAFACLGAVGTVEAGDGSTAGYHYQNPDKTEVLTSALDVAAQGEQPNLFLVGINPQCVQSASFRRLAHIGAPQTRR
jgi:hypothetical protein